MSHNEVNPAPSMPTPEPGGFVKTLNNMGFMTSVLDPYSQAFVDFAPHGPGPALDVGTAYGVAALAALEAGANVIANDLDARHLQILQNRAPALLQSKLSLAPGDFPRSLHFQDGSLGAVLICRVFHFFSPEVIEESVRTLFRWLAPGGKAFIVTETPYVRTLKSFIPVYEQRRKDGALWPGLVNVAEVDPALCAALPERMNLLDPDVLTRVFRQAGFKVEKVGTMARTDFPERLQLDGRESVGIIGVKPGAGPT